LQIKRLKLHGFKSFVDPTELVIEPGLTGVVGPNGCGKSNLLEALRWVMGETSYKSMRASSMADVIFSGTDHRPSRNAAEVTIYLDNSKRTAPAEFNDHDEVEISRHIQIDEGSSYRVNGREVRARDVKLLFEDAATGARSHALVRQGQIGEIVNSKPQARRRILEDAAGIAGLHSRRHEAEMRLKGADNNLARLNDLMGQLSTQVNSLKRQARQAKKYKELSTDIKRSDALINYLSWTALCQTVEREEINLRNTLSVVVEATTSESTAIRAQADAVVKIKPLREEEAKRAAGLQRLKIEEETLIREKDAADQSKVELMARVEGLKKDIERELERAGEARDILQKLEREEDDLKTEQQNFQSNESDAVSARDIAKSNLEKIEQTYSQDTQAFAELKAEHNRLNAAVTEQRGLTEDLKNQLAQINRQTDELSTNNSDKHSLAELETSIEALLTHASGLENKVQKAETHVLETRAEADQIREDFGDAKMNLQQYSTEIQTLTKVLQVEKDPDFPPVLDMIKVDAGYETALGAALGDDLEASTNADAPASWRKAGDPTITQSLPIGATPLINVVSAPDEISLRLSQIGIIDKNLGEKLQSELKPGQRLVSKEGDLWRWDGFTAHADAPLPAAIRLVEKNRLSELKKTEMAAREKMAALESKNTHFKFELRDAEDTLSELRLNWRAALTKHSNAKEELAKGERAAREINEKLAAMTEAGMMIGRNLHIASERHALAQKDQTALAPIDDVQNKLNATSQVLTETRNGFYRAQTTLNQLQQHARNTESRLEAIAAERQQWSRRQTNSEEQNTSLTKRLEEALGAQEKVNARPDEIRETRERLMTELQKSEEARKHAADELATAENNLKSCETDLRAIQSTLTQARENKARTEAHLEGARERRSEQSRIIRENLECAPEDCLALAELDEGADLPELTLVERKLQSLKSERDRLGGVNLRAEEELAEINNQFDDVDAERVDLEAAITKLRTGISQLNSEGRKRLLEAFDEVNVHFKKLFTTLFGGGTAELQLIESDDPLEAGLEIMARPPGKKPNVMSLLSGGEQALTAMSLIFAVFLTNPSPICVLDEVDAPLDDANVDRYCAMIEEMARSTDTRFLIITHHPATMARMRRLFGVTMAERGISQLVSVDLQTAEKFLDAV